ncbi:MAG: hypothetical protein GXO03_02825 [Aquificae bacterium]|nr:hypothetical protein [Aquificota bacterium]
MGNADYKLGLELLKRFKEYLERMARASEEELKELIETVKEPIRNAAYRIKQGEGPLKEELLEPLSVMVREFREMANLEEVKKAAQKLLEVLKKVEEKEGG